MENKQQDFVYTYSAKEQDEIKRIREKYISKEDTKMKQLRRLDAGVTKKGTMISIIIGVIGAMIFGAGMSCVLVWNGSLFVPGIIIGLLGLAFMVAAYPAYIRITEKEKEKVAPEILRLTEELIKA